MQPNKRHCCGGASAGAGGEQLAAPLHELRQRLIVAVIDQVVGPLTAIGDGRCVYVNPEVVIERREKFLKMHGTILGVFPQVIRGTDYLTSPHAAACEHGARHLRPMVATAVLVDEG